MRDDDVVEATALAVVSDLADPPGCVVADRYRLTTVLGHGANADVYRAHDERLGREVAVKLFHPGQGATARFRFGAEARALARMSHPGLVGIYDAGVDDDDRPYLVMELVDGESLRERLLAGPLATDDVVLLGARLAVALAHAHGSGVVHRDIKPSNIVLDTNGSPHLADFGIALLLDAARPDRSTEIMGTAAYLAPEQILGVKVGSAADIYSLGLVLLECLTGELEYPGLSKVESALTRLHRQPRIPEGIPGVLAELLGAMTARDAEDRPAARDCAAWFWAVREHHGMSGRAARAAAASWLARKGKQFNRPRRPVPVLHVAFTGWRRFAVAGACLAMAILASTWLFTGLLPRFMPLPPTMDEAAPPPASIGIAPHIAAPQDGPVMHVAAALAGGPPPSTPAPPPETRTAGGGLLITSTLWGPPAASPPNVPPSPKNPANHNQLQDYPVRDTPDDATGSSVPPTDTSAAPTDEPTPTGTTDAGPTPTGTRSATAATTSETPSTEPTPPPTPGNGAEEHPPPTRPGFHFSD
ncbi:MAG TPA: serine/threonine-protein kinase [Pseudonocardiaceae bacterium]|nr:serine/threonine-protein kinase [Pseudonocardiaceae bacterium]